MSNAIGDEVIAEREHECVVCHRAVLIGQVVRACTYDILLVPRNSSSLVWAHPHCAVMHHEVAHGAPLYSTGWMRLARPQKCASCRCELLAGDRAWRVVDYSQRAYVNVCQKCALEPEVVSA